MAEQMTSRERWLAALAGDEVDRIPFWPKIDTAYPRHQAPEFRAMTNRELQEWLGSDLHEGGPDGIREVRTHTSVETSKQNGHHVTTYATPNRTLTCVQGFDEASWSYHPIEFPVKTPEDIATLTEVFADLQVEPDHEQLAKATTIQKEFGERGVCATGIGISPLMDWLQHLAGVQNGTYLLYDHPDLVEGLFSEMHRVLLRRAGIIAEHHPFPVVYSVENTSTTLISPDMFRRHCMPVLTEYGDIVTGAGKTHMLHMCGKLGDLLDDIGSLPAQANEAFTSAPVGDTSLLDGRTHMPDRCLVGGTNATLWLEPANRIIETIERDLSALPHQRGIVLTSGGVMPPACKPETIRAVRDWVATQAA